MKAFTLSFIAALTLTGSVQAASSKAITIKEIVAYNGQFKLVRGDAACLEKIEIRPSCGNMLCESFDRVFVSNEVIYGSNSGEQPAVGKMTKWKHRSLGMGLKFRSREGYFRDEDGSIKVVREDQRIKTLGLIKGKLNRMTTSINELNGRLHYYSSSEVDGKTVIKRDCLYRLTSRFY